MAQFLFKRSGTADKRPDPAQMALGELDLNYDDITGGIFYKNSGGTLVKVGPAQVSASAPNATPAGSAGNALGEFWYDTGASALCIWDGSAWQATGGGGGISPSTFTACGDLIVGTGAGTYAALPIPRDFFSNVQNGCLLTTCSTEASGLAWISPPYLTSTALNASSVGALIVNGCDLGGGTCFTAILPGPGEPGQILTNAYNAGDPGYLSGQGYLNWCTPNFISQSSFSPGALVVGCTPGSTGGVCTIGGLTNINSPGVAVGYYQGVTVTTCTGAGAGALANVNVINGGYFPIFDSVEVIQPGTAYALNDQVGFEICGTTVTTTGVVSSLDQSTICKAGYLTIGTNGQVLTVDDTCALGVKWATTSGGSGIPCACITGQGALITGTAANTPTALSVGTAGQVLTVDLTCSTGLKWATPSSASDATPLVAGVVFGRTLATGTGSTALGSGALRVGPVGGCNVAVGLNAGCGINNGACNTIVGALAGDALTDGCNNTVLGFQALSAAATICDATAIGSNAMCVATGAGNTAVGSSSMRLLTSGSQNTAVGTLSLCSNLTGTNNTAVGFSAGTLITGNSNTLLGSLAGKSIAGGSANTGLGRNALCTLTSGGSNTALGNDVLLSLSTGQLNTAVGASSMGSATGSSNIAIGAFAGCTLTSGSSNVIIGCGVNVASPTGSCQLAIGFATGCNWLTGDNTLAIRPGAGIIDCAGSCGTAGQFLMSNGANAVCWGVVPQATATVLGTVYGRNDACFNTAYGQGTLACMGTSGPFVGGNVAVGCLAMACSTSGTQNVAIGMSAMCNTSGALFNVAVGGGALASNTNGNCNVVLGQGAAPSITGSWCNIAIGTSALGAAGTVFDNVAIGTASLSLSTGCGNVAIGHRAGSTLTTGGCNVIIGNCAQAPVVTGSCQLAIGYSATCNWLTGCSDKAIRPGAGIMDCAGSTGTAGQVLMSNGANALCWGTASGGGISQTIIDAKGDLIVGCAADCAIRLGVGSNGQVLVANSACSTGLEWVNGSGIASGIFTAKGQLIASCAAGVACALSPGGDGELLAVCAACPTGFTWAAPGGVAAAQPYTAGAVYGNFYLYCEGYPPFYCSMSFGYGSLANTSGLDSAGTLAIGHDVLQQAICSFSNTAIGISAMTFGNENQGNVAIGNASMYGTCCATNNVAIGNGTLAQANGPFLASGEACGNVAVGTSALQFLSSGSQNIAIGDGTGSCVSTGDNNILIGAGTGNSVDGLALISTESNRILMGNCFHTCAQIQVAWSTVSDVRDKALDPVGVPYGLLFVEQLEPIAYRWCNRCTNEVTDEKLRYGFSAQNVRSLEGDNAVIVSDDNPEKLMITDQHLLPVLVNAIKELSDKNKLLEERIAALEDKA